VRRTGRSPPPDSGVGVGAIGVSRMIMKITRYIVAILFGVPIFILAATILCVNDNAPISVHDIENEKMRDFIGISFMSGTMQLIVMMMYLLFVKDVIL